MADCKAELHWHIVMNGDNCPPEKSVVVGFWISTTETIAELCYYVKESNEWFSASPNSNGDAVLEPDYWIETPD
jgi:hypothetical protein